VALLRKLRVSACSKKLKKVRYFVCNMKYGLKRQLSQTKIVHFFLFLDYVSIPVDPKVKSFSMKNFPYNSVKLSKKISSVSILVK